MIKTIVRKHLTASSLSDLREWISRLRFYKYGKDVRLTPTEYELLHRLMMHAGKVLTHRVLLRSVWGPEYGEEADYLRVYVRQLRRKVEVDSSHPQYILTEPGVGYVFQVQVQRGSVDSASPANIIETSS